MWAGILTVVVFAAILFSSYLIYRNLSGSTSKWSLQEALSEEVETSKTEGTVVNKTVELKASSSRLIALFGLIAIMILYVGAALSVLYKFAEVGQIPADTDKLTPFFLAGGILFAPYIVNKFSNIFAWLKPGK
jgi:hypothetical protein